MSETAKHSRRAALSADAVASDQTLSIKLLKVVDELDSIEHLVDAARLVSQAFPPGVSSPIETVLSVALGRLEDARNELDEAREELANV